MPRSSLGLLGVFLQSRAGLAFSLQAQQHETAAAVLHKPTAAAPITQERAEAIGDAMRAAAVKERGTDAGDRLGASMQQYLAKILPAAAIEANALELELRVAPGDGAQLRLAKVCAREVARLCGEQQAAPAIDYARSIATGVGFSSARTHDRAPRSSRVLAASPRR
jgi:hypothetical protein